LRALIILMFCRGRMATIKARPALDIPMVMNLSSESE